MRRCSGGDTHFSTASNLLQLAGLTVEVSGKKEEEKKHGVQVRVENRKNFLDQSVERGEKRVGERLKRENERGMR